MQRKLTPIYSIAHSVDLTAGDIAAYKQSKLCVMRNEGFAFRSTDTFSQVSSLLRSALPELFDYLLSVELDAGSDDEEQYLSSWLVCIRRNYVKIGTTLDVYSDDSLPNGDDIVNALKLSHGKSKVAPGDRVLYLSA